MSDANTNIINRRQNKAGSYDIGTTKSLFGLRNEESVDMGVADGALSLLLEMLSDVSSNRGAYVLREAYSNAYDATKATGDMTRPIDITIPEDGSLEENLTTKLYGLKPGDGGTCPIVTIEDNGIGMSEDDVRRYFLQYGGSKKRDAVDAIGSKGLGSKAPLAVTDTFEVRTRQGGVETRATINRTESKNTARIVTRDTDEPDGTMVLIPVMDETTLSQMRDCAKTLAMHNVDANLLVNGRKARRITDIDGVRHVGEITIGQDEDGGDVSFDLYWSLTEIGVGSDGVAVARTPSQTLRDEVLSYIPSAVDHSKISVVIGGYPYDITNVNGKSYYGPNSGFYYVIGDPGYLNFTPSRDEIKIDKASKGFYDATRDAIYDYDYSEYMTRVFEGVSPHVAISIVEEARGAHGSHDERAVRLCYAMGPHSVSVPISVLTRDGHCLLDYARNNPLHDKDGCRGKRSHRVIGGGGNMLVVSRHRVGRSKCAWYVDGSAARRIRITRHAMAKDYAIDDVNDQRLSDWDAFLTDSDFPLTAFVGKGRTNVIIDGYDPADTAWMMGKFASIARFVDGKNADCEGHVIRLFCVTDDGSSIDSVAEDILNATGDVTRVNWDELKDGVKDYVKRRNAERRTERSGNPVHGDCHIVSVSKHGRTTADVADFVSDFPNHRDDISTKGVGDLTDDEVAGSIFVLTEDSTHPTKSFVAGLAVVRDEGNDIDADNVILLVAPDTRYVRYLESRGARFAFDVRKGGRYRPKTIADEDGRIGNVRFAPCYCPSASGRGKFQGAKLTMSRRCILDGYDTDATRWKAVRDEVSIESVRTHVTYYERQEIQCVGNLLGNDETVIGRVSRDLAIQRDCQHLVGRDADDLDDYRVLGVIIDFDDDVSHDGGLVSRLKGVTAMLERSGLAYILVNGHHESIGSKWDYDEDTLGVIRETVIRRIMEVDAGLVTVGGETASRLSV